jgi:hypothetical protein
MSLLSTKEIIKLVDVLIGEVEAVGESREDENRLENLNALICLTDDCLSKISLAARTSTRQEESMRKIGRKALKYLAESAEWFDAKKSMWMNQEGR